ncbi:MAG: NPCBM/NEW2 domain-containing protein, partial [Planctomycetaceae bacterium]|nr:NPCBM/NEW2 domain-containing protein [Planctomycetaceae bacterium]
MKTIQNFLFNVYFAALNLCLIFVCQTATGETDEIVPLTKLNPYFITQDYGSLQINKSVTGTPLTIGDQIYESGFGTHAKSNLRFELDGLYDSFQFVVGVDNNKIISPLKKSSVVFRVFVDGKETFNSGIMNINSPAKKASVSVKNANELWLIVDDADNSINCDHANWVNTILIRTKNNSTPEKIDANIAHKVIAKTMTANFNQHGYLLSLDIKKNKNANSKDANSNSNANANSNDSQTFSVKNNSRLVGCIQEGDKKVKALSNGGLEITSRWKHYQTSQTATVHERFTPDSDGTIRWETEVIGDQAAAWTTPIQIGIQYLDVNPQTRFWTTWGDPRMNKSRLDIDVKSRAEGQNGNIVGVTESWGDPLLPQPLDDVVLHYGLIPYLGGKIADNCPIRKDLFCIPLISILAEKDDTGISLAGDLNDKSLDVSLHVSSQGLFVFRQRFHKICNDNSIRLNFNLIHHESDWRGGLRWMSSRYPEYFYPNVKIADEIAGLGAYAQSPGITELCKNAEKYHKMYFKFNWQASFDFPYMGMFVPPCNDDVKWKTQGGWEYSINQYNIDAKRMREKGFHTLSYFNVTEFGANVRFPFAQRKIDADSNNAELWRDCNNYLPEKIPNAAVRQVILQNPQNLQNSQTSELSELKLGGLFKSWAGCVFVDAGDPTYREFILNQAKLHIEKIPDASGICIDRMDWLRHYNPLGDDKISWYQNRKNRSLLVSWRELMDVMGPMFHKAEKAIYVNNLNKRMDLLKHVDGIYDEHTYYGAAINMTAFNSICRPAVAWTLSDRDLQPDPDAYFQRYLYMGIFPTAPIPNNDHTIRPGVKVDKYYLDYGKMFSLLRGKRWVLSERPVEVKGKLAKANVFEVEDGFTIPIILAEKDSTVELSLRNLKGVNSKSKFSVLHAGEDQEIEIQPKFNTKTNEINVKVPTKRG